MNETILQFGTGNFLRGFVDCFVDEMNKKNLYGGKIVVVSPTDSKAVAKINGQQGVYNLFLRGIENGKEINKRQEIHSISRAVNPYQDFDSFIALAENPNLKFIVSNTTEAGIEFDATCKFCDKPPKAFPAKLARLLYERYAKALPGFVIFACELIDENGKELKNCVLKYARLWGLESGFLQWIENENHFCSTLVDRIVTGYPHEEADSIFAEIGKKDDLLNTAEPYHLWVIEGNYEDEFPLKKAGVNVVWAKNIAPYKKMKVRILNGAHTSLVFPSLLLGVETVRESLENELLSRFLNCCLFDCILPTLSDNKQADEFARAVLERFSNPYIRHMWRSIALNSISKYSARVLPIVFDYFNASKAVPAPLVLSLVCLLKYYKNESPQDDPEKVQFIKNNDIHEILLNKDLWGADLSFLEKKAYECEDKMNSCGLAEAIKWSMF